MCVRIVIGRELLSLPTAFGKGRAVHDIFGKPTGFVFDFVYLQYAR